MRRYAILVYGILCYLAFFGTFLYAAGFLANLGVPKSIDSGTPGPLGLALIVNLGLLSVFAIQHSVMARPAFKRWFTRFIPEPAERSTYVLLSVVAMGLIFAFWQPIGGHLWNVESGVLHWVLRGLFVAGLGLVFYATILIDHFDLFGLRQVVLQFQNKPYTHHPFATPSLYRYVRHPLYVGWFTVFWATPAMSYGHLLFAAVCTAYILVAVVIEESDLVDHFGETYARYRETTPKFIPSARRESPPLAATPH